jgi:hypothetical protein
MATLPPRVGPETNPGKEPSTTMGLSPEELDSQTTECLPARDVMSSIGSGAKDLIPAEVAALLPGEVTGLADNLAVPAVPGVPNVPTDVANVGLPSVPAVPGLPAVALPAVPGL